MQSRNLNALLNQPDGIASLMPQAKRLLELRRILDAVLPESLSRSCSIANYKQGKIVIFAGNSAVASKLKLLRPTLAEQLSKRAVQVTGIDVQVQPPAPTSQVPEKTSKLTEGASASLARLSQQLPDSQLKNVIVKLARRHSVDR